MHNKYKKDGFAAISVALDDVKAKDIKERLLGLEAEYKR